MWGREHDPVFCTAGMKGLAEWALWHGTVSREDGFVCGLGGERQGRGDHALTAAAALRSAHNVPRNVMPSSPLPGAHCPFAYTTPTPPYPHPTPPGGQRVGRAAQPGPCRCVSGGQRCKQCGHPQEQVRCNSPSVFEVVMYPMCHLSQRLLAALLGAADELGLVGEQQSCLQETRDGGASPALPSMCSHGRGPGKGDAGCCCLTGGVCRNGAAVAAGKKSASVDLSTGAREDVLAQEGFTQAGGGGRTHLWTISLRLSLGL